MAADSPTPPWSRAAVFWSRGCVLLLIATAVAALTIAHVRFNPPTLLVLSLLTVVALLALPGGPPARWAVSVAAGASLFSLARYPPLYHAEVGPLLAPGLALGWLSIIAVGVSPWIRTLHPRYVVTLLALIAAAYALIVLGGRPLIDVWIILRDAADGLLAGRNPYEMTFPEVPEGQTADCFNYLPATFLLTAPGKWFLGDVRWMEAGYLLLTIAVLAIEAGSGNTEGRSARISAALLVGVLPGTMTLVQQAWNEPILLCGVVLGAVLIARKKANFAVVPFAIALATKQHIVLFLPLLALWPGFGWRRALVVMVVAGTICLPWFLANPERFYGCTVAFYVSGPMVIRSQSVWQLLPDILRMPALIAALAVGYAIILWRVPRTAEGLLIAGGAVFLCFGLFNKQTFFNQWLLAAQFLTAGVALSGKGPTAKPATAPGLR